MITSNEIKATVDKITDEEKMEIIEHEMLVKDLTKSFEEVMKKMVQEDPNERHGCIGHPSQED